MVLILDCNSEIETHVRSNICYVVHEFCFDREKPQIGFFSPKLPHVMSDHVDTCVADPGPNFSSRIRIGSFRAFASCFYKIPLKNKVSDICFTHYYLVT